MSIRKSQVTQVQYASGTAGPQDAANLDEDLAAASFESMVGCVDGINTGLSARAAKRGGRTPNAFCLPVQSIASKFGPNRIARTAERNPRYHGYFMESGAQAQASHDRTQRILKGALR